MLKDMNEWTEIRLAVSSGEISAHTFCTISTLNATPKYVIDKALGDNRNSMRWIFSFLRASSGVPLPVPKLKSHPAGEIQPALTIERPAAPIARPQKCFSGTLASAWKIWIGEAKGEEERKRRSKSDFLRYKTSKGLFADFYAMRHSFITNLCRANVSPRTALARHSDIRLTMNTYSHVGQQEQAAAIGMLKGVE